MKIKKLLLAFGLVFMAAGATMAQNISVGPRLGFTSAKISSDDLSTGNIGGLQVGAVLNYGINDMFSAQPELLLVQKGGKAMGTKTTMNYIELPVLAKASIELGEFTGFATGGPTFGYLMSGKYKDDEGSADMEFEDEDNRFEAGLSIGIGAGYNVGPGTLNLDIRYGLGLTNLNEEGESKNRVFGMSVAYLFGM